MPHTDHLPEKDRHKHTGTMAKRIGRGKKPADHQLRGLHNFGSFGNVTNYKLGHRERPTDGYKGIRLGQRGAPNYPHLRDTAAGDKINRRKGITHGYRRGSDVKGTSAATLTKKLSTKDATDHMKITSMKTRHTTYKGHGWTNYKGIKQ